ncbi:Protein phosphatase 1 regulatory subunit 3C-B [Bagarius yarrelli]|uniref:Protein phosphatase 1 regulatory subunit 3C-B n=1 Tax=Bagarius yarrelli TaxID=175774 RepID=A0A556U2M1_BAGYA|nr:Protein phosphatase 1 regulatory subunit 3C-B [Bagarius yarrelli]
MPVDLGMHCHPPIGQLLGTSTPMSHHAVFRPGMCELQRSRAPRSPQIPSSLRALNCKSSLKCTNPCGLVKKKKQVVFADAKGLALTAVRIFKSDPPISDVEQLSPPVKMQTDSSVQRKLLCLRLGFPQPYADLPSFLESLTKTLVRLESCSLRSGSLFGKVRVCNVSPEKAVHVRITYDSWRSHQDIPCTRIQQKNENSETELFLFNIPIPCHATLQYHLEFYVSFRPGPGNTLLLDSNNGRNYRIIVEEVTSKEACLVEKRQLRPKNFKNPQMFFLRNGPAFY